MNFITNILLPPESNVLRVRIILIDRLRAVDQKGYICWSWTKTDMPVNQKGFYTSWLWTNTDMTYSVMTGRVLTTDENGYLRIKYPRNHKTLGKLASGMNCGFGFLWSALNIFACVNSNLHPN